MGEEVAKRSRERWVAGEDLDKGWVRCSFYQNNMLNSASDPSLSTTYIMLK